FPSSNQSLNPTTTTLTAPALIQAGQAVTFTVTVHRSGGSGVPSGTVSFEDGTTVLATASLNAKGQATFTTTALSVGSHNITAIYSGDSSFAGSASAAVTVQVTQPTSPYGAAALGYL